MALAACSSTHQGVERCPATSDLESCEVSLGLTDESLRIIKNYRAIKDNNAAAGEARENLDHDPEALSPAPPSYDPNFAPLKKTKPCFVKLNEGHANGVLITSEGPESRTNDRSSAKPFKNLYSRETSEEFIFSTLKGKKVLSIAEGTGQIVPALIQGGINVKGMDVWYDAELLQKAKMKSEGSQHGEIDRLSDYYSKHKEHLVAGSALDIPYQSETIEVVLSQYMFNNLSWVEKTHALAEIVRVLSVGGEARIAFGTDRLDDYVFLNYKGFIEVETKEENLLVLRKLKSTVDYKAPGYYPGLVYPGGPGYDLF